MMNKMICLFLVSILLALVLPAQAEEEIHVAVRAGDLEQVKSLITDMPSLVDKIEGRNFRPIHFAADRDEIAIMTYLINAGADLNAGDADGDTPLHWAVLQGHVNAVKLLLDHGAEINKVNLNEITPLHFAAQRLNFDLVELLVQRGADLEIANDYGRTPLLWTTREGGDLQMARLLLRLGADVNARDRFDATPLNLAAWRGFRTLVNIFLDHGADVSVEGANGYELMRHSIERGLNRLYQEMLSNGFKIDVEEYRQHNPLQNAAQGGSKLIVADLISRGFSVNAVDRYGWSALHYAAARGRLEVTRELLAHGAEIDQMTTAGQTPMSIATSNNRSEVVALLRRSGAEISFQQFPPLSGPYLGQKPPGRIAEPFAPDIVAIPWGSHSSVTFSPDAREAFWSAHHVTPDSGYVEGTIFTSRIENGFWTPPERAPFAAVVYDDVPFFSTDGNRLYFLSHRPINPGVESRKENIWLVEREADGWGEPRPLPPVINNMPQHWQISVADNRNVYFNSRREMPESQGIYMSRFADGEYTEPVMTGIDGSAPYIAPDESYLIYARFLDAGLHLFITFATSDGNWSEPIDLTGTVSAAIAGMCPLISPDGRYLFMISDHDISWIDAGFIEKLRAERMN